MRDKQLCNLSEIIVRADDTEATLLEKAEIATILGTLQATLTNFGFVSEKWPTNTAEEALLGVSMTGIMDNELTAGIRGHGALSEVLNHMRDRCREVNAEWAEKLGINPAAAITCVKPSGCTTLDTEIKTSSGCMSMLDLFALNGVSEDAIRSMSDGTWIEPKAETYVFDENNEQQKVTKLFVNGVKKVYKVTLEDGSSYRFTGNHKLKTTSGWKRVDELSESDEIIGF